MMVVDIKEMMMMMNLSLEQQQATDTRKVSSLEEVI